ncbi:MAG TPA: GatB/YqeY domain-containing protein [Candidatus Paceibacterota bacterium]
MHEKIQNQIKDAMRAKDQVRLTTLRGVLAAFTNEAVAKGKTPQDKLGDDEALAVIRRLVKQRKDSIEQFEKGGRQDLADSEKLEMKILEEFLPAQMSEEKIKEIVEKTLRQAQGDNSPILKNRGAFIGTVIKETAGQADGALVKRIVEEILG